MKNILSALFVCVLCMQTLSAQTARGLGMPADEKPKVEGKTYALIIGISKYENFPSLKYADKDARAFYDLLVSGAMAVPDSNIRLLLNEKAKAGNIWGGFSWLQRKAIVPGDKVFIYFSGHGDAANEGEAYLLANDAPNANDPNLYNAGGTFQIYNLKMKVKEMTSKGLQVILITDACRTNELPGKSDGARWTFERIMEKQAGEIQMTSCAANEQSLESADWGGGRGIFSYHLINGLSGLADNDPEDGIVTLYELEKYVKDNVRRDTKSISTGKPRQNPVFCCSEMDNDMLVKVDSKKKQELLAQNNKTDNTLLAYTGSRGKISDDAAANRLYQKFEDAIDSNYLIQPDTACASYYYKLLTASVSNEDVKADLKDALVAALNNDAQKQTNGFIMYNNENIHYKEVFSEFSLIEELLPADNYLVKENRPKKIWAEVFYNLASSMGLDAANNMLLIDSALKLKPGASFLLFAKGGILLQQNKFAEAEPVLRTAIHLSPNWQVANVGYATVLASLKMDSALYYAEKAYKIDTNNLNPLMGLGNVLYFQKEYAKSNTYWRKLISATPKFYLGYYMTAACFDSLYQPDSAYQYFSLAYTLNSTPSILENMAEVEIGRGNFNHAIELCLKALAQDSSDAESYYVMAQLMAETSRPAESLTYLERGAALQQHSTSASDIFIREKILEDKSFATIKNDKRFIDLVDKYFPENKKE